MLNTVKMFNVLKFVRDFYSKSLFELFRAFFNVLHYFFEIDSPLIRWYLGYMVKIYFPSETWLLR